MTNFSLVVCPLIVERPCVTKCPECRDLPLSKILGVEPVLSILSSVILTNLDSCKYATQEGTTTQWFRNPANVVHDSCCSVWHWCRLEVEQPLTETRHCYRNKREDGGEDNRGGGENQLK